HGRRARALPAPRRARRRNRAGDGAESGGHHRNLPARTRSRPAVTTLSAEREFELTDSEFKRLRELVHARTGIALSDAKRELVYGRLARRLRKLKLTSFAEYCRLVE